MYNDFWALGIQAARGFWDSARTFAAKCLVPLSNNVASNSLMILKGLSGPSIMDIRRLD